MPQTLESIIEKEYETVQKEREALLSQRADIDQKLDALEIRLRAAANYKATLEGKFSPPAAAPRQRKQRTESGRAPRGSREQLKSQIIQLLKQHPTGLVSNQITGTLSDNKAQIPNVLSMLKADGKIKQDARRGPYYLPSEAS